MLQRSNKPVATPERRQLLKNEYARVARARQSVAKPLPVATQVAEFLNSPKVSEMAAAIDPRLHSNRGDRHRDPLISRFPHGRKDGFGKRGAAARCKTSNAASYGGVADHLVHRRNPLKSRLPVYQKSSPAGILRSVKTNGGRAGTRTPDLLRVKNVRGFHGLRVVGCFLSVS